MIKMHGKYDYQDGKYDYHEDYLGLSELLEFEKKQIGSFFRKKIHNSIF